MILKLQKDIMTFLEDKWLIRFWSNKSPNCKLFSAFTVPIVGLNKDKISQEQYQ